jgi:bifunctional non-homologous end joining protein LigD
MPQGLMPMLAVSGSLPRDDAAHAYEVKWDGVRVLSYVNGAAGPLRLQSRNAIDITVRYPELAELAELLGDRPAIVDGEVIAFDEKGRPNFGRLQHRMHLADPRAVRQRMADIPVSYIVFDVLWLDGSSVMGEPYVERRRALEKLGLDGAGVQVPASHVGGGAALLEATRRQGLEGVVAKRLNSIYEPGRRSRSWTKVKNHRRQEVVIGGWMAGSGNRQGRVGALLVGYYEGPSLRFAGRVGTGFTEATLDLLDRLLAPLARDTSPFSDPVPHADVHWVEPRLVAEVEFSEWTANGTMRHPSFKGLRDDKAPTEVIREPDPGP